MGCFVRGGKNGMGCYVRGDKNSMGCYVRGDKNCMGCFVRGGKSLWDVLSGVAKNGMGCFVPGCFVRLPQNQIIKHSMKVVLFCLILYVPSTIFQLNRDRFSWVRPVLSLDKCVLLMDHNTVRLEPSVFSQALSHCAPSLKIVSNEMVLEEFSLLDVN